tara:strand:+ start:861 stop:2252 length:1392 start_codon:yes stop_codon:yes gene_type:complete
MKDRVYLSENELLTKGQELLGKSLYDLYGELSKKEYKGKGRLGNKVEEIHYHIENNNKQKPDVENLGIEIKTNPLKTHFKGGFVPKERVVLGMIDFSAIVNETFETSSYLKKNRFILYNMYLDDRVSNDYNYNFLLIDIIKISQDDLDIIENDWNIIRDKAKKRNADDLSQSDTNYLAAVTKGAKNQVPQPYSVNNKTATAKRRAFAYKASYINHLLKDYKLVSKGSLLYYEKNKISKKYYKILDSSHNGNIENAVKEKFIPFYGLNDIEIADKFGYIESFNKGVDKSRWHWNTSMILTGKRKKYLSNFIEEFSKSGLTVKTIRVSKDNQPKEEISFRTQDYAIDEDSSWTESSLYQEIGRKFLWVVYKESSSNSFFLERTFFWSIPQEDLNHIKLKWNELKSMFIKKDFRSSYFDKDESFYYLKIKDRFGGKNKKLNDDSVTSLSHWFRKDYVRKIIESIGY